MGKPSNVLKMKCSPSPKDDPKSWMLNQLKSAMKQVKRGELRALGMVFVSEAGVVEHYWTYMPRAKRGSAPAAHLELTWGAQRLIRSVHEHMDMALALEQELDS